MRAIVVDGGVVAGFGVGCHGACGSHLAGVAGEGQARLLVLLFLLLMLAAVFVWSRLLVVMGGGIWGVWDVFSADGTSTDDTVILGIIMVPTYRGCCARRRYGDTTTFLEVAGRSVGRALGCERRGLQLARVASYTYSAVVVFSQAACTFSTSVQ